MKRNACILLVAFLLSPLLPAQEPKPPAKPLVVDPARPAKPEAKPAAGRRELSLRQRRSLGLTITNLAAIGKELKAEGAIDKDTPNAEIAALIALRLEETRPETFAAAEGIDIDAILDLIETWLPFILRLLDLFSE